MQYWLGSKSTESEKAKQSQRKFKNHEKIHRRSQKRDYRKTVETTNAFTVLSLWSLAPSFKFFADSIFSDLAFPRFSFLSFDIPALKSLIS